MHAPLRLLSVWSVVALALVLPASPAAAQYLDTYESQVVTHTNAERAKQNAKALTANACVDGFAERHAAWLAKTGKFQHQDLAKVMKTCKLSRAGENIARGGNVWPSGKEVVKAWMGSSGHRANILKKEFRVIGVGAARPSSSTTRTFVQVFGTPR
jgi:uncharacterized protein YkwD